MQTFGFGRITLFLGRLRLFVGVRCCSALFGILGLLLLYGRLLLFLLRLLGFSLRLLILFALFGCVRLRLLLIGLFGRLGLFGSVCSAVFGSDRLCSLD